MHNGVFAGNDMIEVFCGLHRIVEEFTRNYVRQLC